MKLVVLLVIYVVALNPTFCQGRSLEIVGTSAASSDGSLIRRTRSLPDTEITDSQMHLDSVERRKKLIQNLMNSTDTFKDCAKCFRPSAQRTCVCDATELVMHIQERHRKGKTSQLKNLSFRLRQQVFKRMYELLKHHWPKMRKFLANKKNPHRFLLALIKKKRNASRSILSNHQMIIF